VPSTESGRTTLFLRQKSVDAGAKPDGSTSAPQAAVVHPERVERHLTRAADAIDSPTSKRKKTAYGSTLKAARIGTRCVT